MTSNTSRSDSARFWILGPRRGWRVPSIRNTHRRTFQLPRYWTDWHWCGDETDFSLGHPILLTCYGRCLRVSSSATVPIDDCFTKHSKSRAKGSIVIMGGRNILQMLLLAVHINQERNGFVYPWEQRRIPWLDGFLWIVTLTQAPSCLVSMVLGEDNCSTLATASMWKVETNNAADVVRIVLFLLCWIEK